MPSCKTNGSLNVKVLLNRVSYQGGNNSEPGMCSGSLQGKHHQPGTAPSHLSSTPWAD